MTEFTHLTALREQQLRTRIMVLEYAIDLHLSGKNEGLLERVYSNEWTQLIKETDMNEVEIVERKSWFGRSNRVIVSGPSWKALKVWRDEQTVCAPSALWLRDAAGDALDEIERLRGMIGEGNE